HEANPLDPKNLVDLQARVRAEGADLGLAFDGLRCAPGGSGAGRCTPGGLRIARPGRSGRVGAAGRASSRGVGGSAGRSRAGPLRSPA
ncbi:hypothetical protein AB0O03_28905, partial [Streptomyces diastaticus]|uniref:hypothetical protein n=1 Tax=Streptomyces diastaticus TaxID=1956 RepID=UPI00344796BE